MHNYNIKGGDEKIVNQVGSSMYVRNAGQNSLSLVVAMGRSLLRTADRVTGDEQ